MSGMKTGPFAIRGRRTPLPKVWEHGGKSHLRLHRAYEWQVVEGRKIVFRADTFKQAEKWAKENMR